MPFDGTLSYQESPDHIIIWLDTTIGDRTKYQQLKAAFSSQANPTHEIPVKLNDKDFQEILQAEGPLPVVFEGVYFLLSAHTDIEDCLKCFEEQKHKKIFFITSGSLGKEAVPKILQRFPQVFTDPLTGNACCTIYVFCHDVRLQMEWTLDYLGYLNVFNFDADVLARMTFDIADYFLAQANHLLNQNPPNNEAAQHRLTWARELYWRYSKMEGRSMKRELQQVDEILERIEKDLKESPDDDE